MKKLIAIIYLFTAAFSAQAETLPSLMALATPTLTQTPLIDDKFPLYLEEQEDYNSAILEWQRIIYKSSNINLRSRGLYSIARLYHKLGENEKSIIAYQRLLTAFPQTKRQTKVLYQISRLSDLTNDDLSGPSARNRLLRLQKNDPLTTEAELHTLWTKALTYSDTFSDVHTNKAKKLKSKLSEYPVENSSSIGIATTLALLPGFGYMYLGYFSGGILILIITAALFYSVTTAMKEKHWGYGFVFGLLATFFYVASMFHTSTLSMEKAYNNRLNAMETLTKLQPKDIQDFSKKPRGIAPSIIELVEFLQPSNTYTGIEK